MHLSLMSIDELPPVNKNNKGSQNGGNTYGSTLNEPENNDKNSFETSHELCKDAMLEKIVLIYVAYFCTATEMRFIIQKTRSGRGNNLTKKDSEMYHAKALHICSLFLPKECPLVQHVTQSYNKNYLKDKKPFNLDNFMEELGVKVKEASDSYGDQVSQDDMDIDEGNTNMKKAATNKIKESISVKKVNSTKNSQRLVKISLNDI